MFSLDAKIWAHYLRDAERVAKERAERWKTWLDSILIFAGLFAGVVASFVSNGTSGSLQPTSESSIWISGLWFCSLVITIFGAVMGVLAKTWITNYTPVSDGKAQDVYYRLLLDRQAENWHLERVILVIPLLIQIASFLFAIGLAIQTFSTNRAVGIVITVLVGAAVAAYILSSIIATANPQSFPFRTPLSDLLTFLKHNFFQAYKKRQEERGNISFLKSVVVEVLVSLKRLYVRSDNAGNRDREVKNANTWTIQPADKELAKILMEKLLIPTHASYVDEALLELNRLEWEMLDAKWRDYFCQPFVLECSLGKLDDYMTSGAYKKATRYEALHSHIKFLMHLIIHFESKQDLVLNEALHRGLNKSLKDGGLQRWDIFQEEIRPFAFCLRTHVLLLLQRVLLEDNHTFGNFTNEEVHKRHFAQSRSYHSI
ncbi:hypothetical protein BDQ17DRAFT_1283721 [Cyathus striatus]|nr:hypothetical protein BDQ17DRAFT_1283721 [Cyathus striatus]